MKYVYTPEEISSMLGININTIYRLLRDGEYADSFTYQKFGRRIFISKESFDNFLFEHGC